MQGLLYWRLDVVMREDDCQIKKDNSPAVMAMVRHLTLIYSRRTLRQN